MKFNWGWGIGAFLLLFLAALAGFVIFAWNQDVNLVHDNYYEKGVDYSAQIDKETRSALFTDLISLENTEDSVIIRFPQILAHHIDSGKVLFFRPSDHRLDCTYDMHFNDTIMQFGTKQLVYGRYIVKMTWYSGGIDFEIDKMLLIK